MQGIDTAKDLLRGLVQECEECCSIYIDNVALLCDQDTGELTEEQSELVMIHLSEFHRKH